MGIYLNSKKMTTIYRSQMNHPYYVDKSMLLAKLFPLVEAGDYHICITRPRRFGKSVMAAMVGSFFGKGTDSKELFSTLRIADKKDYTDYLNQYDLVYIDFSQVANEQNNYQEFIDKIKSKLQNDLHNGFPQVNFPENGSVQDDFDQIFEETGTSFLFVFDEWDCIFHMNYTSDDDRRDFLAFLASITKGTSFARFTYMTGILPISKYSSGSSLNHFDEYTMASDDSFGEYFGFTQSEVGQLYQKFLRNQPSPQVTLEDLEYWYDGYSLPNQVKIYNPRSVVLALERNSVRDYWTKTGPYDEIATYIVNDVDDIKKDLAVLLAGDSVEADMEEFAATSMELDTRDKILSAMLVYGFLSHGDRPGTVRIPNGELMKEFASTVRRQPSTGYSHNLLVASGRMLQATLDSDTQTMEEMLDYAHNTETSILSYNNEVELSYIVNLLYFKARDTYEVVREEKGGKGYVDFLFKPLNPNETGLILELKTDATPDDAIDQIKEKDYVLAFKGKLGEKSRYTGKVLAVGIGYDAKTKEHHCKVEELV